MSRDLEAANEEKCKAAGGNVARVAQAAIEQGLTACGDTATGRLVLAACGLVEKGAGAVLAGGEFLGSETSREAKTRAAAAC